MEEGVGCWERQEMNDECRMIKEEGVNFRKLRINITGPYEQTAGNKTIEFEYYPEAQIPWALTRHYDPSDPQNKLETEIYVDGLGRVLQTRKTPNSIPSRSQIGLINVYSPTSPDHRAHPFARSLVRRSDLPMANWVPYSNLSTG